MKSIIKNSLILGFSWLFYTSIFCLLYFLSNSLIYGYGEGFRVVIKSMETLNKHRILSIAFLILFVASLYVFFFIGKRVISNKKLITVFISCVVPYFIIAFFILRSQTNLAFTRPLLEAFTIPFVFRTQDITNYINWGDFEGLYNRGYLCSSITESNINNALFALVPFLLTFIGAIRGLKNTRKKTQGDVP